MRLPVALQGVADLRGRDAAGADVRDRQQLPAVPGQNDEEAASSPLVDPEAFDLRPGDPPDGAAETDDEMARVGSHLETE